MIGPLFSQSAWNNVTFTGGEIRDPGRTLPRALLLGCGSVVVLYLLANVAYVVTLCRSTRSSTPRRTGSGTAVMKAILGPSGDDGHGAAILISTFGCVNGLVLAGARVYYAMARDGLFFAQRRRPPTATTSRPSPWSRRALWAALLALPVTVTIDPATGPSSTATSTTSCSNTSSRST